MYVNWKMDIDRSLGAYLHRKRWRYVVYHITVCPTSVAVLRIVAEK